MIKPLIESKDVFLLISILLQTIRPCLGLDLGWLVEDKMEDVSSFPKHHLFFFYVCPFLSYACVFTPLSFFSCTPLHLTTPMRPFLGCSIWATCPMPMSLSETFAWPCRSESMKEKIVDCPFDYWCNWNQKFWTFYSVHWKLVFSLVMYSAGGCQPSARPPIPEPATASHPF